MQMFLLRTSAVIFFASVVLSFSPTQQVLSAPQPSLPRLNFSSPSPLIFHSAFSLLQQWPNSFFPNGHTIVPCAIPRNTKLYHARINASFPESPEWFALDAAMSYGIVGGPVDRHVFTFRTTRPVQCIYFDGTSASLMKDGSMDSQMHLLWNDSKSIPHYPDYNNGSYFRNPLQDEYDRATGLCDFFRETNLGGLGWGYEAIVRMNAGFEVIWCNFSSPSIELVSRLNLSTPVYEGIDRHHLPPFQLIMSQGEVRKRSSRIPIEFLQLPFMRQATFSWFHAAADTYGFQGGKPGKGESRVKLDSCGIFSFYDPGLEDMRKVLTSQEKKDFNLTHAGNWISPEDERERTVALQQLGRRRRYNRITNVSISDGAYMRNAVEKRLHASLQSDETCSGIDWVEVCQRIVTDYSSEIFELYTLLSHPADMIEGTEVRRWLAQLRGASHSLVMPYYEYPALPIPNGDLEAAFSFSAPTSIAATQRCIAQHSLPPTTNLSASEKLTQTSIIEVLAALCNTIVPLFLAIELLWLQNYNNMSHIPDPAPETLIPITKHHLHSIEELMAWLGWTEQWTSCSPGCPITEICAIPIWPAMWPNNFSQWEPTLFSGGKCMSFKKMGSWNATYWK